MSCPDRADLVEAEVDRVATQYRESPRLLALMRAYLGMMADTGIAACAIPDAFDLDTAVGDQLTIIGKWLGWPRVICTGALRPVFGFACAGARESIVPVEGFCGDGSWIDCDGPRFQDYEFTDDEVYRQHLVVRRDQRLGKVSFDTLSAAIRTMWGPGAFIAEFYDGEVVIATGRLLTNEEKRRLPATLAVLPVALGVRVTLHIEPGPIFGFGPGWGGICEGNWLSPQNPFDVKGPAASSSDIPVTYVVNRSQIFGFPCSEDDEIGGLCDGEWLTDSMEILP